MNSLPRQFLVKAILATLRRNHGLQSEEIMASRIADQVEIAADVFESHDDPVAVPAGRVAEMQARIGTPEDLGPGDLGAERQERATAGLPQPPMPSKLAAPLIVPPDSNEGKAAMQKARRVTPIRVSRARNKTPGEEPNWDFQALYGELIGETPTSIEVTPNGTTTPVTLERSFQADPANGVVKILYTLAGQRNSTPSSIDNPSAPITVPIDVAESLSIYSPRDIDFPGIVAGLQKRAAGAFAPRPAAITSSTPRTGASLESLLRQAGSERRAADEDESSNYANAVVDLSH